MNDDDIVTMVNAALADEFELEPEALVPEARIREDLGLDSLDIVDMVMTLEDEFGIEVPDEAIENLRTVGDVVNFVDSHQKG